MVPSPRALAPRSATAAGVRGSDPSRTSCTFASDAAKSTADGVRSVMAGPTPKATVCRQASRVAAHCSRAASSGAAPGCAQRAARAVSSSAASVWKVW